MRKALIVGIENYREYPLKGCLKTTASLKSLLEKHENGKPNFTVSCMTDVQHKGKLKQNISKLFKTKCKTVLFYFTGHGYHDEFGFHLVTLDAAPGDVGVSMKELTDIVNESPATNKVVILDCCYAGAAGKKRGYINGRSLALVGNGVTVMASCGEMEEASLEIGEGGIFSNLLIEALGGGAADINGNITPGSIYAFIDKSLGPKDQRPEFRSNISSFIVLRKVHPPISQGILRKLPELFKDTDTEHKLNPSYEVTNTPNYKSLLCKPYCVQTNKVKFEQLQAMVKVGLVVPVGEKHMYFAAMKSKACKLTPLGKHYWRLMKYGGSIK
jgi:hypothetical protein